MSKEKTLHVTRQEVACAKNGNGDTSNESNDVISAYTSIIGPTTSSTTESINFYFYGVGAILLVTGVCAFLRFKSTKDVQNNPGKTKQVKCKNDSISFRFNNIVFRKSHT